MLASRRCCIVLVITLAHHQWSTHQKFKEFRPEKDHISWWLVTQEKLLSHKTFQWQESEQMTCYCSGQRKSCKRKGQHHAQDSHLSSCLWNLYRAAHQCPLLGLCSGHWCSTTGQFTLQCPMNYSIKFMNKNWVIATEIINMQMPSNPSLGSSRAISAGRTSFLMYRYPKPKISTHTNSRTLELFSQIFWWNFCCQVKEYWRSWFQILPHWPSCSSRVPGLPSGASTSSSLPCGSMLFCSDVSAKCPSSSPACAVVLDSNSLRGLLPCPCKSCSWNSCPEITRIKSIPKITVFQNHTTYTLCMYLGAQLHMPDWRLWILIILLVLHIEC